MTTQTTKTLCDEIAEEMPRILEGTAAPELYDHIADCDACRDARHDAERAVSFVEAAGADFRPIEDLDAKLMAALDARSPAKTTAPMPIAAEAPKTDLFDVAPSIPETPIAAPTAPLPKPADPNVVPLFRQPRVQFGAGALAIVAVAAAMMLTMKKGRVDETGRPIAQSAPWSGSVVSIARSSTEGSGGLLRCDTKGESCAPIAIGAQIAEGSTLRTDGKTRAQLRMGDGTEVVLDRESELTLRADEDRFAKLTKGGLVADVAHLDSGANARFALPTGQIEVLGTKFALVAESDRSRVEVTRGVVKLSDEKGNSEQVHAGEEGRVVRGQKVIVAPSVRIAEDVAWSERAFRPIEDKPEKDEPLRGLGELRARKPGQTDERDHAVRLAKHDVKVRVVDSFARTEIDETFTNDTGEELEGIFRFPLPPGAQIERLALEVNGKLEEGAFVDRDKAAAIWRGVIHHAVPTAPKPVEEIIWVPGPWRDPALLEWKRGGRFELKIFPIPAHGSRRIVLAYTETVQPVAGVRRYTYPLPYDPKGSTAVDSFHFDAQVLGNDRAYGVRQTGYELAKEPSDASADRLAMTQSHFLPSGDLTLEYALPNPTAELSSWAYQAPQGPNEDGSPYVVIALRPKLPRSTDEGERDHVLMIDSSRSMVGERFARARSITTAMIREMSENDRVEVMACDATCVAWDGGFTEGGRAAAASADRFLATITPDGAADMTAMVRAARDAAQHGGASHRPLHLLYIGDGGASAGPTKPDHLTAEIRRLLPADEGVLNAVAIGADSDTTLLSAMARGGGGVVVPFVPGERSSEAALSALAATYGTSLRQPELTLPAGFTYLAPVSLDTMRAGGETLIAARMTSKDIEGEAVLRGKVGDQAFEQHYPLHVTATSDAGNAFAPRVYAATRIADLEQAGGEQAKSAIVDLSKRFAVASRYTSLLVLESEAMLTAFGLQRASGVPSWTGETTATGTSAGGDDSSEDSRDSVGNAAGKASDPQGFAPPAKTKAPSAAGGGLGDISGANPFMDDSSGVASRSAPAAKKDSFATPAPAAVAPPPPPTAPRDEAEADKKSSRAFPTTAPAPTMAAGPRMIQPPDMPARRPPPRGRAFIPMRKVWDRKGSFAPDLAAWNDREGAKVIAAEGSAMAKPDNRQTTKELYGVYAQHGRLDRAAEIADRWASRDPLDPEALVARADLAARAGDRDLAIRILSGVVDIRPDDSAMQNRLATLFDTAGKPDRACAHRVTLAEQQPSDITAQAGAIRCTNALGENDLSSRLTADVAADKRASLQSALSATPSTTTTLAGDVRIDATWDSDADLDVALIDKLGRRFSWLGGAAKIPASAKDATSTRAESLAFQNLGSGSYVIEVVRSKLASDAQPVHGSLTIRAVGDTRVVPFTLMGTRMELGRVDVFYSSRLVPLDSP